MSGRFDRLLAATGLCRLGRSEDAAEERFLVKNDAGYFLLVGEPSAFRLVGPDQADLSLPDVGEPWDELDLAML